METAAVETETTEPVVGVVTATAPGSRTTIAPKPSAEARVDLQHEASNQVVVREAMIEDVVPLR
jgi:hypothetical protein